ncbi:MAG TPA: hypothetical protein VGG45_10775 [Terracidiphilus sp.]
MEEAEKERVEAPIREMQSKLRESSSALAREVTNKILHSKDDEIYISASLIGAHKSVEATKKFNGESFQTFVARAPWFYNSQANRDALIEYFVRNDVFIVDAEMFERAARRLTEFYLFPDERPEPEPIPEQEPEAVKPTEPEIFEGFDPETGNTRMYTKREVDRMSADEYRRVFRIYKAELNNSIPRFGPGTRLPA